MVIRALHGFLGRGADWDFLRDAGFDVRAPSLFSGDSLDDVQPSADDVLLGYSMGGRLALQLLRERPAAKAIIVSAGLNIDDEQQRAARRLADEAWAQRFESEEWPSLMHDWNAQPLFGGHEVPRLESAFDRRALAVALRLWSPAALEPLAPHLRDIDTPILWIAGARDAKYVAEGRRAVEFLPRAELWICPDAAHRVPWEQPEQFIQRVREFLDDVDHHP